MSGGEGGRRVLAGGWNHSPPPPPVSVVPGPGEQQRDREVWKWSKLSQQNFTKIFLKVSTSFRGFILFCRRDKTQTIV